MVAKQEPDYIVREQVCLSKDEQLATSILLPESAINICLSYHRNVQRLTYNINLYLVRNYVSG